MWNSCGGTCGNWKWKSEFSPTSIDQVHGLRGRPASGVPGATPGFTGGSAQTQVTRPVVRHNLPFAVGLTIEQDQILAALFAAFAHSARDQRFEAPGLVTVVAQQFRALRIHFHFAHPGVQQSEKKFTDGGRAAHHRNIGPQHRRIGNIKTDQVVQLLSVAGQGPILSGFAESSFGPAQRRAAQRGTRPGEVARRRSAAGRAQIGAGQRLHAARGREIMVMIMMMVVMVAGYFGG